MSFNEFHRFDDSEIVECGCCQVVVFRSGHFQAAVYRPSDYDPHGDYEQYITVVGVHDAEIDLDGPIPQNHCQHVLSATRQTIAYLIRIGDLEV